MLEQLNKAIIERKEELEQWFGKYNSHELPFYSSFDIRNSAYKTVVIDSNVFPAGFNNLCDETYPIAEEAIKSFIKVNFPGTKKIGVIAEVTTNKFYYENLEAIRRLLDESGFMVKTAAIEKGSELQQFGIIEQKLHIKDFTPDLIVSNNDFSSTDTSILKGIKQPITPNFNLGWFKRKKHRHFCVKNELIKEIASILKIDRWFIGAYYEYAEEVNFKERRNFELIANKIDKCIEQIKLKYEEYSINDKPFVFVKGNASTYGMNVIPFYSGEDFLSINSKQRAKMHKSKGGKQVSEVLIQEGVPTKDIVENKVAEPVVYCIGDKPIGGFFRANQEKNERENLNTKGMVFASDLFCPPAFEKRKNFEGSNITIEKINIYKFLAKLGVIAIGKELEELK